MKEVREESRNRVRAGRPQNPCGSSELRKDLAHWPGGSVGEGHKLSHHPPPSRSPSLRASTTENGAGAGTQDWRATEATRCKLEDNQHHWEKEGTGRRVRSKAEGTGWGRLGLAGAGWYRLGLAGPGRKPVDPRRGNR